MNQVSVICNYIANHPSCWEADLEALGIKVKAEKDGRAIFNYGIGCDFANPIVQEARGIIINLKDLEVVCFPFRKFGNYGESYVDDIDWASARVQEKVDGSIMKVYFFNGKWCVATNGTVDAYSNVGSFCSSGKSYGQLFDEGAKDAGLDYNKLDPAYTYIFELVSPEAPIVINYPKTTIYHLGTRNNVTGEEIRVDIGVKKPKEYHLNSLKECIEAAKMINADTSLDDIKGEGYVVVDGNWHRIKIKSPDYLQSHYFKTYNNPSDARVISIIKAGEVEEVCTYFPAFMDSVKAVEAKIEALRVSMVNYLKYVEEDAHSLARKDFFLTHRNEKYCGMATSFFFNAREEAMSIEDYVDKQIDYMPVSKLVDAYEKV